jgi:hypothetical protein
LQVRNVSLKLARMLSPQARLRFRLVGPYWFIAAFIVFAFYVDDSFCQRPGSQSYPIMVLKLSVVLAAWDFVAGFAGAWAASAVEKVLGMRGISVLLTTLIVGVGFAYLPFFIYRGYGVFRFESTWANVSCFFTEGYGFGFLFFLTPFLSLMTFLRELVIFRSPKKRT